MWWNNVYEKYVAKYDLWAILEFLFVDFLVVTTGFSPSKVGIWMDMGQSLHLQEGLSENQEYHFTWGGIVHV